MEPGWTFYHDRIVVNNDFKNRTKLETTPTGITIILAAREVSVDQAFVLNGRNLVILADRFDGSPGTIQLQAITSDTPGPHVTIICRELAGINITSTGAPGPQGKRGEPGQLGRTGRPNKPGLQGGEGGTGNPGGAGGRGGEITLIYIKDNVPGGINAANLQVPGGLGGPGGPGGPGGQGGPGGTAGGRPDKPGLPGGEGGEGGTGGRGGAGGRGGEITLIVPGGINAANLQVPGGPGGPGGPEGPGGPGGEGGQGSLEGENGANGPQGNSGPNGPPGPPGHVQESQATEAMYWQTLLPWAHAVIATSDYSSRS